MESLDVAPVTTTRSRPPLGRSLLMWSAVGFVIVSVLGLVFAPGWDSLGDEAVTTAEEYYAKGGPSGDDGYSYIAATLAALLLLVFADRLRRAIVAATGDRGLGSWSLAGGLIYVPLSLAGAAVGYIVAATIENSTAAALDPQLAITMNNLSYYLGSAAQLGLGVMVWVTSLAALRSGLLPKWLAWVGFVLAAASFLAFIIFVVESFVLLWVLVVGLMLARARTS